MHKVGKMPLVQQMEPAFIPVSKQNLFLGTFVFILAFLIYANSIPHDYALDDWGAITGNNSVLQGISGIPKIFTEDFWHITNIKLGYYRPLSIVTFAVEQEFFHGNSHISHFINVLIFAFSGLMLFLLLNKIFQNRKTVFVSCISVLFIAHPIHTEIIDNIKGRDELLSYFTILLMLWFALKYVDSRKMFTLVLSLFFCYLALLSKETGLVGVLMLGIVLYYYQQMKMMECLKFCIPFVVIVLLFFLQKMYFLDGLSVELPVDPINYPYTEELRLPTSFMLFLFSLRLLFLPHPLRYDYSYNQLPAVDWNDGGAWLGLFLFLAIAAFGLKQFQKRSVWGLALSLFFVTLIPGLAFTYLRGGIFAERFLFMPSLGFCIALVYIFFLIARIPDDIAFKPAWFKTGFKVLLPVCIVFVLYSVKTIKRNTVWENNFTLMGTDLKTGKNSAQNQRHYGAQLINMANMTQDPAKKLQYGNEAILAFRKAIRIYPKFGHAWSEMGVAFQTLLGNTDSAIYYYNKAIEYAPGLATSYLYLGNIYQYNLQQKNVASFYYNQAVKYNPELEEAVLAKESLKKEGLDVQMNPLSAVAVDTSSTNKDHLYYFKEGNYFASQGDYVKAAQSFEKSVSLKRDNEDAIVNLANCYGMLKQYEKSLVVANGFLATHPNHIRIMENISVTYNLMGNKAKSEEYIQKIKEASGK
jgi:tetratricopeptide (TPR) repeat protein